TSECCGHAAALRSCSEGGAGSAHAVLLLHPRLEVGAALLDRAPPRLVLDVPAHRALQRRVEIGVALEADVRELVGVERVAAVVALTVGDRLDERLSFVQELQHAM